MYVDMCDGCRGAGQATKSPDLVIDRKTAKAMGLAMSQSSLSRADEIVQ
jgi:hypothetical protein